MKFPQFQDGSFKSNFKLGVYDYLSLLTTRSKIPALCSIYYSTNLLLPALFYRVTVGSLCVTSFVQIEQDPADDLQDHVLPAMDWCQRNLILRAQHLL